MRSASLEEPMQRVSAVRRKVAEACRRAGRSPRDVRVVAVAKTFPAQAVRDVLDAGIADVGENYVQEARDKRSEVGRGQGTWHLIGGLQRNKVRIAARVFDWVHTVDEVPLAAVLDRAADALGRRLVVLVQVNVAGDPTKRGVRPEDAQRVVQEVARLRHLDLRGLMTIASAEDDPEAARRPFRVLAELRDDLARRLERPLPELSMGMSGDFGQAIEEGATLVRIGRALFGERTPPVRLV